MGPHSATRTLIACIGYPIGTAFTFFAIVKNLQSQDLQILIVLKITHRKCYTLIEKSNQNHK